MLDQPQYQRLGIILGDKLFRIPEYQRHYSWQKKQRDELFEDIKKLHVARKKYEDRTHFMATIVCLKTNEKVPVGSNNFYIYDVVDGQQRLTTLVILLKAISLKLKEDRLDQSKIDEAKDLDKLLVKDNASLIILQTNHDNRDILRNYLQDGQKPEISSIKTTGDKNISEAIKECEKFVLRFDANAVNLLALIKNDLFSEEEALKFFKGDCTRALSNDLVKAKILENTRWLKEITSCLSKLYSDKRREAVTDITQARLLAVAIMLRTDLNRDREKLLEQWERTSFKIYGFDKRDARKKVGDYVRLAKFICKDRSKGVDDLLSYISGIGNDVSIESAVTERFKNIDLYTTWAEELRYFFFRYEEYLSKISGTQLNQIIWNEIWESNLNNTIEHILPQDKTTPGWNHITDAEHQELQHSIGNLCLLSPKLNSEASNKCFNGKRKFTIKPVLLH